MSNTCFLINCVSVLYNTSSYSARYTFSGKEKDSETGLSYFGSRYYSSDLSIWLSVDPMAGKYPSQSNYAYCSNNPLRFIDPNGEDEWDLDRQGNLTKRQNGRTDIDIVYATNAKGEEVSREFAANTVNQGAEYCQDVNHPGTDDEKHLNSEYMLFHDDNTASDFFYFAAENTDVEWGQNSFANGTSVVGTSHDETSVNICTRERYKEIWGIDPGKTQAMRHSHTPKDEISPSDHTQAQWAARNNVVYQILEKGYFLHYDLNTYRFVK